MSKVLVVDDSATMRRILSKSLVSCGVSDAVISTASNGRAALEQIEEELPELLLCDVAMPVLDGIGLMKELAARDIPSACHILFITSLATDAICEELLALGAYAVLPKPFNPTQLRRQIRPYLDANRKPANTDTEAETRSEPTQTAESAAGDNSSTPSSTEATEGPVGGCTSPPVATAGCAPPLPALGQVVPDHDRPTDILDVRFSDPAAGAPDGPVAEQANTEWQLWLTAAIANSVSDLLTEMLFVDGIEVHQHPPNDTVMYIGEVDIGPDRRDRLRVAATRETAAYVSRAMLGIDGQPNDIERCDSMQEVANIIGGVLVRLYEHTQAETNWSLGIANSSVTAPGQHRMHGSSAFRWGAELPLFVTYVVGWR